MSLEVFDESSAGIDPVAVALDPFSFFPGSASRIAGLGGSDPLADPNYVFHTPYVRIAEGPASFMIEIDGLTATRGQLMLGVNALPLNPGSHARQVKSVAVPLRELTYADGRFSVMINARSNLLYAILGQVYDETDAAAAELRVTLTGGSGEQAATAELLDARRTVFGKAATRDVSKLISLEPATLADPVSQMCTSAQIDEPAYDYWMSMMADTKGRHRKQWEFVFILQALKRYGMLEPGSHGIGFGVGREPIPAVLAAMGCKALATDLPASDLRAAEWSKSDQHVDTVAKLSHPEICSDDDLAEAIDFRAVDMTAIPDDLHDFDFCWSACAFEHLGSIKAGLDFVGNSLRCLKPGGVAVHTTEFNLSSDTDTVDHAETVLFRRRDMERLALDLVGRGHEFAQLKYDQGSQPFDNHVDLPPYNGNKHLKLALGQFITTSFGIIIRKGSA